VGQRRENLAMTRGFFLGKFMPPHRGHLFVCKTARRLVDEITVLVCSTGAEPIEGKLRYQWMREAAPFADVLHMHRDIPQTPEDHPDFWTIWRIAISEFHPEPIDIVFGSDLYVFRLAEELGAKPALIDPDREIFSVSGEAIRENPVTFWSEIARPARPYFQKRLCLLGPESAGKTRLAAYLSGEFQTKFMPEYGRIFDVFFKQSQSAQGENWTEGDLLTLAETHAAMRAAMAPDAGPLLIEDTDAIQTALWAEFLLGKAALEVDAFAANDRHADHYFLLAPDVDWIDDGVRYAGDEKTRTWFFDEARKRLDALKLSYDVITGRNWAVREKLALRLVKERFGNCLVENTGK
jgi:HTH-type transcriptional repressor of NAD biosynthesis genes